MHFNFITNMFHVYIQILMVKYMLHLKSEPLWKLIIYFIIDQPAQYVH